MDYWNRMRMHSLESAYLNPLEHDEPNAYDDWWHAREDTDYEEMSESRVMEGESL